MITFVDEEESMSDEEWRGVEADMVWCNEFEEEKIMAEFKVGDMVRCVNSGAHTALEIGKVYTVDFVTSAPVGYVGLAGVSGSYAVTRFEAVSDVVASVTTRQFQPGDTVRRIGCDWQDIKVGDVLVVEEFVQSVKPSIRLKGHTRLYDASKFELVELQATATPQAFNYPETDEDKERAARDKLRAYKRGMRDWLYGTTSGEET